MSLNSKKKLLPIALELSNLLRKNSTEAENILWERLRSKRFHCKKFLRQHPLFHDIEGKESFFIVDFYCHENKLAIEIDGGYHKYRLPEDQNRTLILNYLGIKVIRFKIEEISSSIDTVLTEILRHLR
jgi:very-short-patch-repair endonuclease